VSGQIQTHLVWVLRAGGLTLIDQRGYATYETSILNAQLASITQRLKRPFDVRATMRRKSWKCNATTSGAVSSVCM
jgi:hypothetical protein